MPQDCIEWLNGECSLSEAIVWHTRWNRAAARDRVRCGIAFFTFENGSVVADYSREGGEVGDIRRGEERLGLAENDNI